MKIKKILACILPISLGISPISIASISSCSNTNFEAKDVNLYLLTENNPKTQKLYFLNTMKGIPFIDLNDAKGFAENVCSVLDSKASIKTETNGYEFKLTRENGATLTFNFNLNTVSCDDINLFKAASAAATGMDLLESDEFFYDAQGKKIEGQTKFIGRRNITTTKPTPMDISLGSYNINIYKQGDKFLVPFATFYNIAFNPAVNCLFNGQDLFLTLNKFETEGIKEKYYSFAKQARSKELKEYNYYEFCRDLDYVYGLKEEHHISSFDKFFTDNGLKDLLLSDNRYDEDKAYCLLQYFLLADNHTGFGIQNAYGGYDPEELNKITNEIPFSPDYLSRIIASQNRGLARSAYKVTTNGAVNSPIILNDDTLIVTFDSFSQLQSVDFYYSDTYKQHKSDYALLLHDTPSIISYANDIIQADVAGENKIKNVVIDLSANTGGRASAALFVLGWVNSAIAQLYDPIYDYTSSMTYAADVNFDKVIDEKDRIVQPTYTTLPTYQGNVYCLISGMSFSCGNYVPAMMKQTGKVKLIGTTSGGGACAIHNTATADGSGFTFSSNLKLCTVKNGSYYSIDRGAEPDYYLDDMLIMYGGNQTEPDAPSNRAYITQYVKSLKPY